MTPVVKVLITMWLCARCDHKWQAMNSEKPKICPRCKSKLWDVRK